MLDFAIAEEIERAFQIASWKSVEALVPLSDPMALGNSEKIATLSMQCRVPVVSPFREITEAGGVLSYGPDLSMLFRGSARVVDQILKGAKPGDLPIGKPTKFELVMNLKTAKALGLTIPQSLLLRADEVIQ